jgi:hypothetical protein
MIDGLEVFLDGPNAPRWFYFKVFKGGVKLASNDDFPERPSDARPSGGNPHTPWYHTIDHWDEHHVHIWELNAYTALERAERIYKEKIYEQHYQTPPSE